jgi:drug/metabolite transporter (DMT)-like permease
VAFWAISAGWLVLLALLIARRRLGRLAEVEGRGWAALALMGFFGWAGYAGSLNYALAHLPLADAVVINYLHPVFTVLLQGAAFSAIARGIFRWEASAAGLPRSKPWQLALGMALCLVGVATIATHGRLLELGRLGSAAGVAAALFAAVAWGVYSNLGRFVQTRSKRGAENADVHTFAAMTFGVLMLGALLALEGQLRGPGGYATWLFLGPFGSTEVSAWYVIGALGALLYCGGFTLWLFALSVGREVGEAHKLPSLTYLTPVLAVLLGWAILHEAVGGGFWGGAALIAAGNCVIVLSRKPTGSIVPAAATTPE